MSDIILTAEEAAAAHRTLSFYCKANPEAKTVSSALNTVLPLLEAIAAGRAFEVRPERCTECSGHGGFDLFDPLAGTDYYEDCPRCEGSGRLPGGTS